MMSALYIETQDGRTILTPEGLKKITTCPKCGRKLNVYVLETYRIPVKLTEVEIDREDSWRDPEEDYVVVSNYEYERTPIDTQKTAENFVETTRLFTECSVCGFECDLMIGLNDGEMLTPDLIPLSQKLTGINETTN